MTLPLIFHSNILPLSFTLALLSLWLTWQAWHQSKQGSFYQDTFMWGWLGIYVWGDGLVLGPFWLLMAIWITIVPTKIAILTVLAFYAIRSAYEVIYWLVHQTTARDYKPPFLRQFEWLDANAAAIVYQVGHSCLLVGYLGLALLIQAGS
jgi:hypothetical protein